MTTKPTRPRPRILRGRDVLRFRAVRSALVELNNELDGPAGVAIARFRAADGGPAPKGFDVWATDGQKPVVPGTEICVVTLPGGGRAFPERAFVEALLCAEVVELQ